MQLLCEISHTHTLFSFILFFPNPNFPYPDHCDSTPHWICCWHGALSWKWALVAWFQESTGASPQISSTHQSVKCSKSFSVSVASLTLICQTSQGTPVENSGVLLFSSLPDAPTLASVFCYTDADTLQVWLVVHAQHLCFGFDRDDFSPSCIVNIVNGLPSVLCEDWERMKHSALVATSFPKPRKWFLMDFCISLFSFSHIIRQETKIPGGPVHFQRLAMPMLPRTPRTAGDPASHLSSRHSSSGRGSQSVGTVPSKPSPLPAVLQAQKVAQGKAEHQSRAQARKWGPRSPQGVLLGDVTLRAAQLSAISRDGQL